jgi:hypothetical protein
MSGRLSKVLSLVLGVQMFLFGFLKFFQPFDGWFDVQIQQSHLPHEAILAGKVTELLTGVRVFDPVYADGRRDLCPLAACGASQRSAPGHQDALHSCYRACPWIAGGLVGLEGTESRESKIYPCFMRGISPDSMCQSDGASRPEVSLDLRHGARVPCSGEEIAR